MKLVHDYHTCIYTDIVGAWNLKTHTIAFINFIAWAMSMIERKNAVNVRTNKRKSKTEGKKTQVNWQKRRWREKGAQPFLCRFCFHAIYFRSQSSFHVLFRKVCIFWIRWLGHVKRSFGQMCASAFRFFKRPLTDSDTMIVRKDWWE